MRGIIAVLILSIICGPCIAGTPPTKVEFLDVFDRADGPVGDGWTSIPSTPGLTIFHNSVCASTQNVGLLSSVYKQGPNNYITYEWYSQTVEGFETYALVSSAGGDGNLYAMGCDGGFNQSCTPTIRNLKTGSVLRGNPIALFPTILYRMEAIVQSTPNSAWPTGMIGMRLHDINGSILYDASKSLDAPLASYQLGLLVGRSGNTCATNYLVETAWDFNLIFKDSFDRADGPPGPNYLPASSLAPMPQIAGQQLCGTTQSIAIWAQSISPSQTYRIQYDFGAATDQGLESYSLAASLNAANVSAYLAGCDGGGAGCVPVIRQIPGDPIIEGLSPKLEAMANYKFIASYQPDYATFRVYSADGLRLLTVIATKLPTPSIPFDHLGVLVGRQGQTCINNLEIYGH